MTTSTSPTADSTAPRMSKGRVGSAGSGSTSRRLSNTITTMIKAWKTNAARQLIAEVIRPPINGPAAAPTPPIALITPNARARDVDAGEQQRREDVDRRDQQRGADTFEDRVADDEHTQTRSDRAEHRADAVHDQTEPEQPHPAVTLGQLPAGDHQRRHHQQEDRDRDLDTLDGGVQVLADVVDHHVHVRTGETADELRQRERNEHSAQRRGRSPRRIRCRSPVPPDLSSLRDVTSERAHSCIWTTR